MFIIHWVFDKLGYMPKISVQVGVVKKAPAKKKPVAKKTTTRKPAAKKAK
jgi:hypothetical protein